MGELAVDGGKPNAKEPVQVSVTSVKEDEKDKAESAKPGPNRILRYAEVLVQFARDIRCVPMQSY